MVLDDPDTVTVVAHDEVGLLYRTAGVLALHSLDVINASVATHAGMAVNTFLVQPRFGRRPDVSAIRADLVRAVERRLGLAEKLAAKERAYRDSAPAHEPARILWFDDEATDATIMEVRTSDAIGLLFRLTAALERAGLDIRSARLRQLRRLGRGRVLSDHGRRPPRAADGPARHRGRRPRGLSAARRPGWRDVRRGSRCRPGERAR